MGDVIAVFLDLAGTAAFVLIALLIRKRRGRQTVSSDGHSVPDDQDLTCSARYGHSHGAPDVPRYIVHEDPPEGWVVLNGVRRKIEDCRDL